MENLGPYSNFHELNQDWFLNEFNKVLEQWKAMQKNFDSLQDAFNDLKSYVQDYFKNLDVQDEINNKLNEMVINGELSVLLSPLVNNTVNDLTAKINALQGSISGLIPKSEDINVNEVTQARTTFDGISYDLLNERLMEECLYFNSILTKIINTNRLSYNGLSFKDNTVILDGNEQGNSSYKSSNYIVLLYKTIFLHNEDDLTGGGYISFYDVNKTYISQEVITGYGGKVTAPVNAYYFRFSIGNNNKNFVICYGDIKLPSSMASDFALFNGSEFAGKLFYVKDGEPTNENNSNYTLHAPEINVSNCYFIYSDLYGNYFTELNDDFTAKKGYTLNGKNKCVPIDSKFSVLSSGKNGIKIPFNKLNPAFNNVVFYGDSITCLGNDLNINSWQYYFSQYFNNKNLISVGIGGTAFTWDSGENGYDLNNFETGNSLPKGATIRGDAVHSSFCSYDRIRKTIPQNATCVIVMGGTNDINSNLGNSEFDENSNYDTPWRNATNTGDFNINTLVGGILSTIMKIRYHAPYAHIILCSPIGGRGKTGEDSRWSEIKGTNGLTTIDIRDAIEKCCVSASVDFIDVFGTSGISIYNRGEYITDTVHPNTYGMMCIGKSICTGVKNLIYKPNREFEFAK